MRRLRHLPTLIGFILAAVAISSPVRAHVEIEIDPRQKANELNQKIVDLRVVEVAVLGSDHLDVRTVRRRSLRFGTPTGPLIRPLRVQRRPEDLNGDGYPDLLLRVRMSSRRLAAFREPGGPIEGRLTGLYVVNRALRSFEAFDSVLKSSDPSKNCSFHSESSPYPDRMVCTWTAGGASYEPVDYATLVNNLNQQMESGGFGHQIQNNSRVWIEALGGMGHRGTKKGNLCASPPASEPTGSPGNGGTAGYAGTLTTSGQLQDLFAQDDSGPYVYIGTNASGNQGGGSSSLVMAKAVTDSTDVSDVLVLGGGGGGGAAAHDHEGICYNGRNGGNGAKAIAPANGQRASIPGEDGQKNNTGGGGGNQTGTGLGGSGAKDGGNAGNPGIGGFGAAGFGSTATWVGTSTAPPGGNGHGGQGESNGEAGAGGGGYGGGGGGATQSASEDGGGGGGGSVAAGVTVSSDQYIVGPNSGSGDAKVVFTFEVFPID